MSNNSKRIVEKIESKTKIYLVIIAILLVILCIYEDALILPSVIVYSVLLGYTLWINSKRIGELSKHIHDLTINVDTAAKNTLINSPFPLVILETDGNIIWKSFNFNKEFENVDINSYLDEISKEVKISIENEENKSIDKQMQIEGKTYHIIGEYIESKSNKKQETKYMMTLYFLDITENINLEIAYNNSKSCIGILMIDNYEEIIQRVSAEEKAQLTATIEKTLYDWATSTGGIMVKTERDTFVYMFEHKYLDEIENGKFSILDTIKEIKIGMDMPLTISIAISTDGNSNYEKYTSAQEAIDIVLGRGGDQAVVKKNGKYIFYGGRTQEVEKRTKVKARTIANALEKLIQESKNVMIMGHVNPDMDCMGASLGIYRLAKSLGKEVYIINNSISANLENFAEAIQKEEEYNDVIIDKSEALVKVSPETLLVIVDTHKYSYVEIPELLDETEKIVIIDHHRRSTDFIENSILTFHEVYASSASELVTEILQYTEKPIELTKIETESLYAGIMMDTKNFTFKTGVRTFEAAAYLRKFGVDIVKVKKWFQSSLENYRIIADIVKNAEIINQSIGISEYETEDKNASLICAKAADELLTISDITASFVIGNTGEKICISGRSIGDINVQVILEKLRRWRTYNSCRSTIRRCNN